MLPLTITPKPCWFLRTMIVSCGSRGCYETMRLLESVKEEVPFDQVAKIEGYGYRLKAFERLERYANQRGLKVIGLDDVADYFGGNSHIGIMAEFAGHAGLAKFLGEAAGLVTHVLLPLNEKGEYENAGRKVYFENAFWINPEAEGTAFFHLGLIVKAPVSAKVVAGIKDAQASNKIFMEYLAEMPEVVRIPVNYYKALNCAAKK